MVSKLFKLLTTICGAALVVGLLSGFTPNHFGKSSLAKVCASQIPAPIEEASRNYLEAITAMGGNAKPLCALWQEVNPADAKSILQWRAIASAFLMHTVKGLSDLQPYRTELAKTLPDLKAQQLSDADEVVRALSIEIGRKWQSDAITSTEELARFLDGKSPEVANTLRANFEDTVNTQNSIKPCTVTFSNPQELLEKLQKDCQKSAVTLIDQIEKVNAPEEKLKNYGEAVANWLLRILVLIVALLFIASIFSKSLPKSEIFDWAKDRANSTPGILLGLLLLTAASVLLGIALIALYKYSGIGDDFGQGSGSVIQAVWGSAATIAASVVAIVLAHQALKQSNGAQKSEAARYAKEIKAQLFKIITPSSESFALMSSRDTYQMHGVTQFFAAMMLTRLEKRRRMTDGTDDFDLWEELDPINDADDKQAELRDIYFKLRNARHAFKKHDITEEHIYAEIKQKFIRELRADQPDLTEEEIAKLIFHSYCAENERTKYYDELIKKPDQEWLGFEKEVSIDIDRLVHVAPVEGDIDEVVKGAQAIYDKHEKSIERRDSLAVKSLLITYIEHFSSVNQLLDIHEKYRKIRTHFHTAFHELESMLYVLDVASESTSYDALSRVRRHIDKLDNLFSDWESDGKGESSYKYFKWILTRYSLAQLIRAFILNTDSSASEELKKSRKLLDSEENYRVEELDIQFWLIFLALPIDDQDLTIFTIRENFSFIEDLYLGLLPFKMNGDDLATRFGLDDHGGNKLFRYKLSEQFSRTVELLGIIKDQLNRMISDNRSLIRNDIGLKDSGSWNFWEVVFCSALYPPEASYSVRVKTRRTWADSDE